MVVMVPSRSTSESESDDNDSYYRSVKHFSTPQALKKAVATARVWEPLAWQGSPRSQNANQIPVATDRSDHANYDSRSINDQVKLIDTIGILGFSDEDSAMETISAKDPLTVTPSRELNSIQSAPDWSLDQFPKLMFHHYKLGEVCDWKISNLESSDFMEQTIENEIERLLVLKSYNALDTAVIPGSSKPFDRLAAMASRIFDLPLSYATLMDLDRLYFLGSAGIPKDALPEIPRQISFCNYTMLVKNDDDVFVIPDTLEDDRFSGNFFVTTALFLRFYAGVPLVSPEGCRLGTFCILDLKPRPDGMSDSEKESLRDLAKIAVDYLVSRREQNMGEKRVEFASQMLARAANDLRTPLHGVQLSLAMMQENFYTNDLPVTMTPDKVSNSFGQENSVSYAQKDCLDTARACTNMIGDICNTLRPQEDDAPALGGNCQVTLLLEEPNSNRSSSKSQEFATTTNNEATLRRDRSDSICSTLSDSKSSLASICDVRKLMKSLISMVEYIPKQVPVLLKVDKSVPHHVLAEQLPIFRATLNLLSLSCDRAVTGNIEFVVRTRMEDNFNSSNALYFECIDYGPPFELCDLDDNTDSTDSNNCDDVLGGKTSQNVLLQNFEKPTLSSINAIVRSLGGGIGYTSLLEDKRGQMDREVSTIPTMLNIRPTTKFWFKIPLLFPEYSFDNSAVNIDNDPAIDKKEQTDTSQLAAGSSELNETQPRTSTVLNSDKTCNESNEPSMRTIPKGRALIIDDSVIIRKTLTRALSGLGYSCTVAEDGLVGLKHLQSSTYDVVLCDFLMPVMDGLDCVREYRQWEQSNRQNFRQYFVGMSAHGNTRDGEKAKRLGMDRFEPKPISLQTLHDIANEVHYRKLSDADAACGTDEYNEGLEQPSDKLYQTDSAKGEEFTCLIGACQRTLKEIGQIAIDAGHFPMLVDNIYDLVQKMKSRNWSVVMIDELLVQSNRADVLQEFRDWESLFRFHRQKEVYLITQFNVDACDNHSKSTASILLPSGVDDVVEYPGDSDKILHIFQAAKEGRPVAAGDIIVS